MQTERLTFPGGWWADVRLAWPYGADTRIAGAVVYTDDPAAFENSQRVMLVESVTGAHVPDLDGNAIAFGPEMWDNVDGRIGRAILKRARLNWGKWQTDADPNVTEASSPASQPE